MPPVEGVRLRRRALARDLGIFVVLALLVAWLGTVTRDHAFIQHENLVNLLRQSSILAVASIGMTLVVLTGGIDLAVGSVMALAGVLAALLVRRVATPDALAERLGTPELTPLLAVLIVLLFGGAWGVGTATLVTRLEIPPLITTLGTMSIGRGAVQWLTGAESVHSDTGFAPFEQLQWLGSGFLGPIPAPVVVATVVALSGAFLLRRTIFGTWLYAIGCNEEACRLSGVPVRRVKTLAYMLAGAVFALAGVMNLGRQGYALPAAASGFELNVVTAVVLGGVSITGGEGHVPGVIAGVLILGSLENGLIMLNLPFYEIMVLKGAVLLAAVAFDRWLRRAR